MDLPTTLQNNYQEMMKLIERMEKDDPSIRLVFNSWVNDFQTRSTFLNPFEYYEWLKSSRDELLKDIKHLSGDIRIYYLGLLEFVRTALILESGADQAEQSLEQLRQNLILLIEKGELSTVGEKLKHHFHAKEASRKQYNQVIVLTSALSQLNDDKRIGIIEDEEVYVRRNQIVHGFLELIEDT